MSTIAHIGVSEFAAYSWTKRINRTGSLGFGSDTLSDDEVGRPIACQDLIHTTGFDLGPVGSTDALERFDARRAPELR